MMNISISFLESWFTLEVPIQVTITVTSRTEIIPKEDGWSSMTKLLRSLTFLSLKRNASARSPMSKRLVPICSGGKVTVMRTYFSMRRNQSAKRIKIQIISKNKQLQYLCHYKINHLSQIPTNLLTIWMQIYTIVFGPKMKHSWNLKCFMIKSISSLSETTFTLISSYNLKKKVPRRILAKSNHNQEYLSEWSY